MRDASGAVPVRNMRLRHRRPIGRAFLYREPAISAKPSPVDSARRLAVLGLAAVGIGGGARAAGADRVIRALAESWPPYVQPVESGAVRGLDAELLQAICERAGYRVSWVRASMERRKRRFLQLLDDQIDVIFSATPTKPGPDAVMYTRTYRQELMMVAAPADHDPLLDTLRGFDDLLRQRVRLLYVEANGLGRDFEAYREALRNAGLLAGYATGEQGVQMLRAGRGALILGDALDLQEQSRRIGFPLVRQPYGYSETPVSLLLSRLRLDETDLQRINHAIADLEQRGVLAAIRSRYALARDEMPRHAGGVASCGRRGAAPIDCKPSR